MRSERGRRIRIKQVDARRFSSHRRHFCVRRPLALQSCPRTLDTTIAPTGDVAAQRRGFMGLHKSHFSLSVLSAGAFQMAQLSVGLEGMMSSFAARRLSAAPAPAANSRVRPRVGSSLHVRAQGDAGTSGQSAPGGQMSPAKSAKPAVQSKRGGEQKSSAAGSPAPKGQQRRPKAPPGPGSGRQQQPKKQPPPSAQAQSANVLFGSDPPGEFHLRRKSTYFARMFVEQQVIFTYRQVSDGACIGRACVCRAQERVRRHCREAQCRQEHSAQRASRCAALTHSLVWSALWSAHLLGSGAMMTCARSSLCQ